METKFTPGPWDVRDEHPNRAVLKVVDAAGNEITTLWSAPGDKDDADADGVWRDDPARVANARLIAASPELLEVVTDWFFAMEEKARSEADGTASCTLWRNRLEKARSVFAKATGAAE